MDFAYKSIDLNALCVDIKELRREINRELGEEDIRHLRKIERVGWVLRLLGQATSWIAPNPLSPLLIAVGMKGRDTMMHHIYHRSYDRIPGIPKRLTSRGFGRGWRRWIDFPSWEVPEEWMHVHNVMHHPHTNQDIDPDYLQNNMGRYNRRRGWVRPIAAALFAMSWRAVSYGPNASRYYSVRKRREFIRVDTIALPWKYVAMTIVPVVLYRFALLPTAFFFLLGPWAGFSVLCNAIMAEALSNLHSMLIIAPNHSGDDLYAFTDPPASKGEWYVHQIISAANYRTGNDLLDYSQGWLNYQIEHHIWPDLTLRQYQLIQPRVRQLCEKHGIPYVQDSIWRRWRKFLDVGSKQARNKIFHSTEPTATSDQL